MRITYRKTINKNYWEKRWKDIPADAPMTNENIYPLKYSKMLIKEKKGLILEAGCGNGRLLRYYHNNGYKIKGFDFIEVAINKLKKADKTLDVKVENITNLTYRDNSFDYFLAFGLYHNLENNLINKAVKESYRVLKKGGSICASFRSDNIQNKLTDWLSKRKNRYKTGKDIFHKINFTKEEFKTLFEKNGFEVEKVYAVENMPILFRLSFFRSKNQKSFNEKMAREKGYELTSIGKFFQKFLMRFFPDQCCNIYVLMAKK